MAARALQRLLSRAGQSSRPARPLRKTIAGIFENSDFTVTKVGDVAYPTVVEIRQGGGQEYVDTVEIFKLPVADFSAAHAACQVDLAFKNASRVQEWLRVKGEDAALQDKVVSALNDRIAASALQENGADPLSNLKLPDSAEFKS